MPTYTVGNQTFEVNSAGTIVGGNNNGYGYQYSNSSAPATATPSVTPSAPVATPSSSGGSSFIPSTTNNTPSLIPSTGTSYGTSGNATSALTSYADPANSAATAAEIARAQAVYQAQAALGNWGAANSAHDWANQVRNASGQVAGVNYNPINGSSITTNTTQTPLIPTVPEKPIIPLIPPLPEKIPEYVAYQPKEFQATTPNYSISADPSKTSFIPTTRARDRWAQQEQDNALNAYKQYASQFGAYQQGYGEQQDALANAFKQKELETRTIAEQAEAAMKAADAKLKAENTAWERDFEERKLAADLEYRNATLATRGSGGNSGGGSSSGGGLTTAQEIASLKAMNDWVTRQMEREADIDNGGRLLPDNSNYAALYDAWKTMYIKNMYGN